MFIMDYIKINKQKIVLESIPLVFPRKPPLLTYLLTKIVKLE